MFYYKFNQLHTTKTTYVTTSTVLIISTLKTPGRKSTENTNRSGTRQQAGLYVRVCVPAAVYTYSMMYSITARVRVQYIYVYCTQDRNQDLTWGAAFTIIPKTARTPVTGQQHCTIVYITLITVYIQCCKPVIVKKVHMRTNRVLRPRISENVCS